MQELASDNTVPEQVRSRLRVVSEALIAENKTKSLADVNKQVMKGVPGFRGMSEYISEMNTAVQNSDMTQQRILTRDITNFEKNLSSKLAALNTAQRAADTQKRQVRILKNKNGEWFADVEHKVSSKEFKSNNGFTVNPHRADGTVGADKTKAAIESNLAAVTATRLALDEISNGSRTRSTPPDTSTMSFEEEMDALNAYERQFGRDTSARDNDPNAVTVNTNENNEGDLIDNSSSNNSGVPADIGKKTMQALAEAQLEVNPKHHSADGIVDGQFAGMQGLNINNQGNVVLTRLANNESHLTKDWVAVDAVEMESTSLSNGGGRGLPTSGFNDWQDQYGTSRTAFIATFEIAPDELIQAIRDGNAYIGNMGEGEIVLNPAYARNHLKQVNGKDVRVLDNGYLQYTDGTMVETFENDDGVDANGLPMSISFGDTDPTEEQSDNGVELTGTELQAFNIITQFVTDPDADINKIADTVSFRGNGVRLSEDMMVRWFSVDPAMAADSLRALEQEDLVIKVS